jgi:NADH dehydrogenase
MNIVIIGGGFAVLTLLRNFKSKGCPSYLVDKNNYNFFRRLFIKLLLPSLEPSSISYPYRKFLLVKKPSVSS